MSTLQRTSMSTSMRRQAHPFEQKLSDWKRSNHEQGLSSAYWGEALSIKEAQVCLCFFENLTHVQAAEVCGINRRTLDFHISSIIRKTFIDDETPRAKRSITEVLAVRSKQSVLCDLRRTRRLRNKKCQRKSEDSVKWPVIELEISHNVNIAPSHLANPWKY
jgi:hypothetical protein